MTPEEVRDHDGIYELAKVVAPEALEVGEDVEISDFVFLNAGEGTYVGDYSCIHSGTRVVGGGELHVGRAVAITYNCVVVTSVPKHSSHMSTCVPQSEKDVRSAPVRIEDEAFVGSNSVIMPGVTVGEGAVVGALSYVDEDVPAWTVQLPDGRTFEREPFAPYGADSESTSR